MKMFIVLCLALIATLGNCQDDCNLVRVGIDPILAPCRTSVEACVEDGADFERFSTIFSGLEARFQLLRCEGRPFTDQIFAGICGGPSCAGPNQTFSECAPGVGERCYEDAVVSQNNGTAAFEACLCSNDSQTSANPVCPAECAAELERLVEDVGCCVNSAVYSFYFGTCVDSPDEGTDFQANVRVLSSLFVACDVTLPGSCLHPFSPTSTVVSGAMGVAGMLTYLMILPLYVFL